MFPLCSILDETIRRSIVNNELTNNPDFDLSMQSTISQSEDPFFAPQQQLHNLGSTFSASSCSICGGLLFSPQCYPPSQIESCRQHWAGCDCVTCLISHSGKRKDVLSTPSQRTPVPPSHASHIEETCKCYHQIKLQLSQKLNKLILLQTEFTHSHPHIVSTSSSANNNNYMYQTDQSFSTEIFSPLCLNSATEDGEINNCSMTAKDKIAISTNTYQWNLTPFSSQWMVGRSDYDANDGDDDDYEEENVFEEKPLNVSRGSENFISQKTRHHSSQALLPPNGNNITSTATTKSRRLSRSLSPLLFRKTKLLRSNKSFLSSKLLLCLLLIISPVFTVEITGAALFDGLSGTVITAGNSASQNNGASSSNTHTNWSKRVASFGSSSDKSIRIAPASATNKDEEGAISSNDDDGSSRVRRLSRGRSSLFQSVSPPSSFNSAFAQSQFGKDTGADENDVDVCASCNDWLHYTENLINRIIIERCVILHNDLQCLRNIENACYSDLTYKGHRSWSESQYNQLNCTKVLKEAGKREEEMVKDEIEQEIKHNIGINGDNLCYIERITERTEYEDELNNDDDEGSRYYQDKPVIRSSSSSSRSTHKNSLPPPLKSSPMFCSLFGDLHIITYGDMKQTCAILGAWPLVDNAFFTIQITNVPALEKQHEKEDTYTLRRQSGLLATSGSSSSLDHSSKALESSSGAQSEDVNISLEDQPLSSNSNQPKTTVDVTPSAITRAMIIFRSKINCVPVEKVYDTTDTSLPLSFNDGTFSGGHSDNLLVHQVTKGSHVEIKANYINTTVIIRRIGLFLTVSVVTPIDIATALPSYGHSRSDYHMELCSGGCPREQTLPLDMDQLTNKKTTTVKENHQSPSNEEETQPTKNDQPREAPPSSTVIDYDYAMDVCRGLSGFFLETCVFDVMTTGDVDTFVEINTRTSQDVSRLQPPVGSVDKEEIVRSGIAVSPAANSSQNRTKNNSLSIIKSLCNCTLVWILTFLSFLFQLKCSN